MRLLVPTLALGVLLLVSCSSATSEGGLGDVGDVGDVGDGASEPDTTLPPVPDLVDRGQALSVRSLQLSHCWVDSTFDDADALTKLVAVTDCSQPHRAEVFSVVCLDTFDDNLIIVPCGHETQPLEYPGEAVLDHMANQACLEGFEPFVGLEYSVSAIDYLTFVPGESAWDDGDRTLVCSLVEGDGSAIQGSLLGAER